MDADLIGAARLQAYLDVVVVVGFRPGRGRGQSKDQFQPELDLSWRGREGGDQSR
jgi:hypothetical protein